MRPQPLPPDDRRADWSLVGANFRCRQWSGGTHFGCRQEPLCP
jgi:hypothetical protein